MPQTTALADDTNMRRAFRLTDRYRTPFDLPIEWNDTLDTILLHRSVRAYLPDALPEGTIELLVAAAQSAASSSNLQPWSVIAVENPERKARLAAYSGHQKHLEQAPLLLIWLIDLHRLETIGQQRGVPTDALAYLETFLLGAVDTSLAAQNAVLAAESLGLGTVYVGGIRNRPLDVASELDLPPHVFALFGLAVGYPDPAARASVKPRLPQPAILSRETYGNRDFAGPVSSYDDRLHAFQREQGMRQRAWGEQATERVAGPQSMSGREALRTQLELLGLTLT